ncbi:hypothetical protein VTK73DRAFT_5481 [Phialemonium thermophilum]|uniref:Uncharacterized protein n=1 Tax=Phialemonium thermophilum TaxID=223376 RepID=A0ABR3V2Z0_9PEZI
MQAEAVLHAGRYPSTLSGAGFPRPRTKTQSRGGRSSSHLGRITHGRLSEGGGGGEPPRISSPCSSPSRILPSPGLPGCPIWDPPQDPSESTRRTGCLPYPFRRKKRARKSRPPTDPDRPRCPAVSGPRSKRKRLFASCVHRRAPAHRCVYLVDGLVRPGVLICLLIVWMDGWCFPLVSRPTTGAVVAPSWLRRARRNTLRVPTSHKRIDIPPLALHDAGNVARDPPAVVVARLRHHLLAVDIALPGARVEREVALDALVRLLRLVVRPDAVVHRLRRVDRAHDRVVRRHPLPLAHGRPLRRRQRQTHALRR